MATQGIPPLPPGGGANRPASRAGGPPPPPPGKGHRSGPEDSVELSAEALQQLTSTVPDALTSVVSDLQGKRTDLATDLRTIGDYFRTHGGRRALDAFMEARFSREDLDQFQQLAGPPQD